MLICTYYFNISTENLNYNSMKAPILKILICQQVYICHCLHPNILISFYIMKFSYFQCSMLYFFIIKKLKPNWEVTFENMVGFFKSQEDLEVIGEKPDILFL